MEKEIISISELINIYENYKTMVTNKVSEINAYSWSDEFCRKELKKCQEQLYEYFTEIDYTEFTPTELKKLGFNMWDDEEEDVLYLAPIWVVDTIKQGSLLHTISGDPITVGMEELSKESRNGASAFGFRKSQLMKAIRKDKLKELDV
jgi:hypothetical protein